MDMESGLIAAPWRALKGQVAVVTGGASGIGAECVRTLRQVGVHVVAADLHIPASSPTDQAAGALPGTLVWQLCDVSSEEEVRALFAAVAQQHGRLDILINSAGVLEPVTKTLAQELAMWEKVMSVNLKGSFLTCREAGRSMVAQRSGTIINIGSVAGQIAVPASNAYGPSKAGVAHMTRSLAGEWARLGVRVNCIAPGYIAAPMSDALFEGNEALRAAALARVPMGRMGRPEDIARTALFLCSPMAAYITGTVFPVDGGWSSMGGPSRPAMG
ncbi:MAG: SDR family oxidoreductase [Variovorax sp.]